jgi:hypothetical protein
VILPTCDNKKGQIKFRFALKLFYVRKFHTLWRYYRKSQVHKRTLFKFKWQKPELRSQGDLGFRCMFKKRGVRLRNGLNWYNSACIGGLFSALFLLIVVLKKRHMSWPAKRLSTFWGLYCTEYDIIKAYRMAFNARSNIIHKVRETRKSDRDNKTFPTFQW